MVVGCCIDGGDGESRVVVLRRRGFGRRTAIAQFLKTRSLTRKKNNDVKSIGELSSRTRSPKEFDGSD
jgi:hypothetical protein